MKRIYSCFLLGVMAVGLQTLTATSSAAQLWEMEPREPRWGQTVRFELGIETVAEPTTLESLGLAVRTTDQDGRVRWHIPPVRRVDDRQIAEMLIPEGLAYLQAYTIHDSPRVFFTPSKIYRPDGRPARGAWEQAIYLVSSDYENILAKEMKLYPENYSAYRTLWKVKALQQQGELSLSTLRQQIEDLRQRDPQRSDEWLYAMSFGHLLLGEEAASRQLIRELTERFPTSRLVTSAFADYSYQALSQNLGMEGQQAMEQLLLSHLARFPDLEGGGELLLRFDPAKVDLATAEAVYAAWSRFEPGNAMAHLGLAAVYRAYEVKLEEGLAAALRAADLVLQGEMLHYGDLDGSWIGDGLATIYLEAARLAHAVNRPAEALAYAHAAHELATEPGALPHELIGEIWESLARPDRAEQAYRAAWRWGSSSAEQNLSRLYRARGGSVEELAASLQELRTSHPGQGRGSERSTEEQQPAPDFQLVSLSGEAYALRDLRGKVVVLNFWAIGCLPCRAEIPHLNRMVERFSDREVLFLAPTNDSTASLRKFLAKHDFTYEIVPESSELSVRYQVEGIPVHVVIDRNGSILFRRTGGGEQVVDELTWIIERAL